MTVDRAKLASHLDDYFRVSGQKTDRFVCPITLRKCNEDELIDGHILNDGFLCASRRKVIQYGHIDHFYGSCVEAGLVRFLNLRHTSDLDILRQSRELTVTLSDGSKVKAFFAESRAAKKAEGHFPLVDLIKDGKHVASVYLRTPYDSPNVSGPIDVTKTAVFYRYDWVASLVKASYLTFFDMLGYTAVFTPWGDTIRRSLKQFYEENAKRKDAGKYFADFRNAIHVMTTRSLDEKGNEIRYDYPSDTLTDREALVHFTPRGIMFAGTCIFKVNDVTIAVTLPEGAPDTDVGVVLDWYKVVTEDPTARPQMVYRSRYDGCQWLRQGNPLAMGILTDLYR